MFGLDVRVFTENNVSYTPEYWGHFAARKILPSLLSVAATAPREIQGQAAAFRGRIYDLLVSEISETVKRALEVEGNRG